MSDLVNLGLNEVDEIGQSALMQASAAGNVSAVKALCEHKEINLAMTDPVYPYLCYNIIALFSSCLLFWFRTVKMPSCWLS